MWCAQTQSCFFILHYWALWWLCYELVPWTTQMCFMLAGSGQADMWFRAVVVLFSEQLFCVCLLWCHEKLVSVVCCWVTRGTQSCTICYSYTFRSSTPTHSHRFTAQLWTHTKPHPLSHPEPAGVQSFADCHCTSSHSLTVTCFVLWSKLIKGVGNRISNDHSLTIHLSPLQCWMCSSLSSSPHTPSLHALCPAGWTPASS